MTNLVTYQGIKDFDARPADLPEDAVTMKDLEGLTGYSYRSIHNWVVSHGMPGFKCGNNIYISRSEFVEWYEKNRHKISSKGLPELRLEADGQKPLSEQKACNNHSDMPDQIKWNTPFEPDRALSFTLDGDLAVRVKNYGSKKKIPFTAAIEKLVMIGLAATYFKEITFDD